MPPTAGAIFRVDPGELRHKVSLRRATNTKGAGGGVTQTWAEYDTTRARIQSLNTSQQLVARQAMSQVTAVITIRYRAGSRGIKPNDRVVWSVAGEAERIFGVEGIRDPDGRRTFLLLDCKELSNGT